MLVIQQPAESGAPAANHPAGPARCRMVQPWFRQLRWQAAAGVFWSGAPSNGSGRGILHSRHASPAHGDGRSQGCGRALPPHLYRRRLCRNAVAFVRQLDFGAYASVPQHHPEEIWPRGCLRQKSRNSLRQARISGVCATRESRASDFGFRKMGHVQAARADAQGFRDRRARCAEYPVDHRGNRSSEDARISRINSTEMLAPPANQIHGLCSRRADSRTVSEHNGDGDALHLVRWVQRRSTFGLRLWCTDGGFRYFRLS